MRFLHTSDLHLGRMLHNYSLLEDQRYILNRILALAKEKQVDALVVAGDLYDKSQPSAEAVALLDEFLTEAAKQAIPCLLTAGNHDSPQRVAYGGTLMEDREIYLSPVLSGPVSPVTLQDAYGPVDFYLLPFLKPAHVRAIWPEAEINSYTDAVAQVLRTSEIDHSRRTVLVAHQFVTWGEEEPEKGGSETATVGTLDNVDAGAFQGFDYVALGHIHGPQSVGAPHIRYSGSPLKYAVSEWRQEKCTLLVELDGNGFVSATPLPLAPLHNLREVKGSLEELLNPAAYMGTDVEDYLHVVLTDKSPVDAMNRLQAVYPRVLDIKPPEDREGAEAIPGTANPERDPLTLFQEFFLSQNGDPLDGESLELVSQLLREVI